ncbi:MAG: redoxin domain-containing protein, partial [Chloroflexi bacterium]|nr:redoxin domain-containing protein [Chloroflexota bacterium]
RPQQPQRQQPQPFPQLDRQPPHTPQAPQPTPHPPSATWTQATTPPPPIPTPRSATEYEVDRQFIKTRGYGSPAEAIAAGAQKSPPAEGPWGQQVTPRRIPRTLFILMIILGVAIIGLVAYSMGWDQGIISNAMDKASGLLSGIRIPSPTAGTSANVTPLAISNVTVSGVTQTGATISWTTDRPATSQVMICDPDGLCTWTDVDKNLVTQHSVVVSGLKPGTSYQYKALSADAKENETTAEGNLLTLEEAKPVPEPVPTPVPLLLSAIMASDTTPSTATITWQSNQPATSQIEYGTTESYGSMTATDTRLVTSHSATLTGLAPATTYHFRVRSKDAAGTEIVSEGGRTFTTKQAVVTGEGAQVGKSAPNFTLPTLDGQNVSLSNYRGKIVLLNFWSSLPASRNELPLLQQISDTWSKDKYAILTINIKENNNDVQLFVSSKGLTLPVLLDRTGDVTAKYDVRSKPTSFLIDSQGIIREIKPRPFRSVEEIEDSLKKLN